MCASQPGKQPPSRPALVQLVFDIVSSAEDDLDSMDLLHTTLLLVITAR